jgi:hypothetical protein
LLKTHDFVIGDAVTEWHTGIHHALAPCPNLSQPHEAQRSLFVWLRCRVEMDGSHDGTWRLLPMPSKAISGARATVPYPLAQEATPIAMVAPGLSHKGSLDGIRGVDHDECWPWRNMLYFTFICHNLQWVLLCHCFQKEHSTRSASRNRSCFIIFPCPYCFLIVFDIYLIIFCYILLYFASTFDEISERTPQKASELLCRGFSPKTSLPPYRCGWRSLCPGWKGTFARHFPTSRSRCFGWCFSHICPYRSSHWNHLKPSFLPLR